MRALLDTDVILDLLLDRAGFADAAAALWEANELEDYRDATLPVYSPAEFLAQLPPH